MTGNRIARAMRIGFMSGLVPRKPSIGRGLVAVLALAWLGAAPLVGQGRGGGAHTGPGFGARFGRDFEGDQWIVGGQLRLPFGPLELLPSGELYLGDAAPDWQANADVGLSLGKARLLYGGAGLAVFQAGEVDTGLNLFVGAQSPGIQRRPRTFLEARWTRNAGDGAFRFLGGVTVPLGRR